MNSAKFMVTIVSLQLLTLMSLWSGNTLHLPQAQAQAIDPGAQRLLMVEEQRSTNAKLDEMIGLLKGELQVRVVTPDETKAAPAKGR